MHINNIEIGDVTYNNGNKSTCYGTSAPILDPLSGL